MHAVGQARMSRALSGKEIEYSAGSTLFRVNAAGPIVFSLDRLFLKRLEKRLPRPLLKTFEEASVEHIPRPRAEVAGPCSFCVFR